MPIRVHRIRTFGNGSLEIMIHGGDPDAAYVSGRLSMHKGATIDPPIHREDIAGFIYLRVHSTEVSPLTRERAIQMLRADAEIEVVSDIAPENEQHEAG